MAKRFACALNKQGRFAPTRVGDFIFVPSADAHLWQGKTASNMRELGEQMNGALKSIEEFNDPFTKLEIIQVNGEGQEPAADENKVTPESMIRSLRQANGELNDAILKIGMPKPRLQLLVPRGPGEAVTA